MKFFDIAAAMTKATGNELGKAFVAKPNEDNMNAILDAAEANLRRLMKGGKSKPASKSSKTKREAVVKKSAPKKSTASKKPARSAGGEFSEGDKVRVDGDAGVIVSVSRSTCRVEFKGGEIERIPNGQITKR